MYPFSVIARTENRYVARIFVDYFWSGNLYVQVTIPGVIAHWRPSDPYGGPFSLPGSVPGQSSAVI